VKPAPSDAPVLLYRGKVIHARLRPRSHRFAYRVFSILIDLDRLDAAGAQCSLFSVNRWNAASFHENDHGFGDGSPLRRHVDKLLTTAGLDGEGCRVLLLCYPRILGYVFNPLSIYYVVDPGGALIAILYEVRNTFGERHTYVVPISDPRAGGEILRHGVAKAFHVSPFLGMDCQYRFSISQPEQELTIRILAADRNGPVLFAGYRALRQDLGNRSVAAALLRIPFMTLKVVAGIHWEALKLWCKGCPVHPRPRYGAQRRKLRIGRWRSAGEAVDRL
jgi:uncharacterized protein